MTFDTIAVNDPGNEHLAYDVCVVGGGMAGLCAAIAAARGGARTALVQDRAVLGGNASSEVRMWICGAHGRYNKEAGILEEIQLANLYRNPGLNYPLWDSILYDQARSCPGLDLFLSTTICRVAMDGPRLAAVTGWHLTRQRWLHLAASQFIDCSGDSVLRLSGATMRRGREGRDDFAEPLAPATADRRTMGNSILLQLRHNDLADHRPFRAPAWARTIPADHPRYGALVPTGHNFWWCELGGEQDSVADADRIRDDLMALALGVWATIKNHPDGRGRAWELDWIGSLPGKRESFRYQGPHLLTESEVASGCHCPDRIAYGGWTMDDHPPGGFDHPGEPTQFHPAPSPYGIPMGVLYSSSVPNLWCAGRNISATHMAMSSTRVMGTCALLGQAAGTGAALALRHRCDPATVHQDHLPEIQNRLMDADSWLPGLAKAPPPLTAAASISASHGDPAVLGDGIERPLADGSHALHLPPGGWVELRWPQAVALERLRIVADSDLHRTKRMPCLRPEDRHHEAMPAALWRQAVVEIQSQAEAPWQTLISLDDNHQRCLILPLTASATALRVRFTAPWSGDEIRLHALEVGQPDWCQAPRQLAWPEE